MDDVNYDINDLTPGIYGINNQLINMPQGVTAGMLFVVESGWMRLDVAFNRTTNNIYWRFKWGSAGFETWRGI